MTKLMSTYPGLNLVLNQGAHWSGKSQGNLFFFSRSGKSQGILKNGQGNQKILKSQGKVREF